jgi:hypothetical protein
MTSAVGAALPPDPATSAIGPGESARFATRPLLGRAGWHEAELVTEDAGCASPLLGTKEIRQLATMKKKKKKQLTSRPHLLKGDPNFDVSGSSKK